jgi:Na+/melibiose symporter-like transporter
LSWRYVFLGEVVLVVLILAGLRLLTDAAGPSTKPRLDVVGAVLSALGLGLVVFAMLQASIWGWLQPKDSPVEPFGFALTPFVIAAGGLVLWAFVRWQHWREDKGTDPLVHIALFRITPLRAGLQAMLSQNLILMGVFFTIPLYLQLVLGFDALETGIKMLPVSVAMFLASVAGSRLALVFATRTIVRWGLSIITVAVLLLMWTIQPSLRGVGFGVAMALLGVGMGLIASQVGNVVQSSVDASGRSEAGGLQYTAQQLGSAVGVALIGAIVLSGLTSTFLAKVESDPRITDAVEEQATIAVQGGVSFVATDQVEQGAIDAGLPPDQVEAITDNYSEAQLTALKVGLLASGAIALVALALTGGLPATKPDGSAGDGMGESEGEGGDDLVTDTAT